MVCVHLKQELKDIAYDLYIEDSYGCVVHAKEHTAKRVI